MNLCGVSSRGWGVGVGVGWEWAWGWGSIAHDFSVPVVRFPVRQGGLNMPPFAIGSLLEGMFGWGLRKGGGWKDLGNNCQHSQTAHMVINSGWVGWGGWVVLGLPRPLCKCL